MSLLKVEIKYNDGIWRPQRFPQFQNEDTEQAGYDVYNTLMEFKKLGFIQDFKVFIAKTDKNGNKYEINIADIPTE